MNGRVMMGAALMATLAGPIAAGAQTATGAAASTHAQGRAANAKADLLDGKGGCVYINQLQGDHALNDHSVIFRANVNDFYQLDFAQKCYALTYPDPKLIITPFGGEGLICHAIDLDVRVGEQGPGAIPESCIPSAFHKMTPAEVAAVPKKNLP